MQHKKGDSHFLFHQAECGTIEGHSIKNEATYSLEIDFTTGLNQVGSTKSKTDTHRNEEKQMASCSLKNSYETEKGKQTSKAEDRMNTVSSKGPHCLRFLT